MEFDQTSIHDATYSLALEQILWNGEKRIDRTGVGTLSTFGTRQVYDLSNGFPAITTKKLAWKAVVSELLWFIEGSGDETRLREILHGDRFSNKTTIWTANSQAEYWTPKALFNGDLGRVYGVQWRNWQSPTADGGVQLTDQLINLIDGLKSDPFSRRHIITAWNPGELHLMALPPCHCFAQFYVSNDRRLDCSMYQRSNDMFLGCPFNIASYSLLTSMIAQCCDLLPGRLIHVSGDAHIYTNHIDQVVTQLLRKPFASPSLKLNPEIKQIDKFTMSDIQLIGYQSHSAIPAPMAV